MLEEFKLSRQTLYNWIKLAKITEPEKDWRGWRMWTEQQMKEIEGIIRAKEVEQLSPPKIEQRLQINLKKIKNLIKVHLNIVCEE